MRVTSRAKDIPLLHSAMDTKIKASWEYTLTVQTEDQRRQQKKSMWVVLSLEAPSSKSPEMVDTCAVVSMRDESKLQLVKSALQQFIDEQCELVA